VSPTPLVAGLVSVLALLVLVFPPSLVAFAVLAVLVAAVVDAIGVRRRPLVRVETARVLARGVASPITVRAETARASSVEIRQPAIPDVQIDPSQASAYLEGRLIPKRRGRHRLPAPAVRVDGPLRLGRWYHRGPDEHELLVYPDLPAARKLALAVRRGRLTESGRSARGPLGLGTEFEAVRDYEPDDDIRQVNWAATARLGKPMSNEYRTERDREVRCLVDSGRLMSSPLEDRSRLDAAVDALTAIALVADELGDRCGAIAFDDQIRRKVSPRRSGSTAVVRSFFDIEPSEMDSDYELAFRSVEGAKRSFVVVFTDILEETAARPLLDAMPALVRHHFVAVASSLDTELVRIAKREPSNTHEVYEAAAAVEVLGARARVAATLRRTGAAFVEAPPARLGEACVRAYLRAKARGRL
jgi:uncharacterized protein (DUF58 family)